MRGRRLHLRALVPAPNLVAAELTLIGWITTASITFLNSIGDAAYKPNVGDKSLLDFSAGRNGPISSPTSSTPWRCVGWACPTHRVNNETARLTHRPKEGHPFTDFKGSLGGLGMPREEGTASSVGVPGRVHFVIRGVSGAFC